jgi:hypothetical protein
VESNINENRRINLLALYRDFAALRLAAGTIAKGLDQAFADLLQMKAARWSQLKSPAFPISDRVARQIETNLKIPAGWLDKPCERTEPDHGEERFLAAAREAWRSANAKGKKDLLLLMKQRRAG